MDDNSGSTSIVHRAPVRCWNVVIRHSNAGTSPRSSSIAGRRAAAVARTDPMSASTDPDMAWTLFSRSPTPVGAGDCVSCHAEPCQIEFQAGQGLSKLVVQLPCNSAPFLFCRSLRPASLATYSGMGQTEFFFHLGIRDDGSTDGHEADQVPMSPQHPRNIPGKHRL